MDVKDTNIFHKPLHRFSLEPPTGFTRDGYCRASPKDSGNHVVAGTVTDAFLDFSASRGNDLRKQAGLKDGQKWCLCANRWKEAFDARDGDKDPKVPKVALHATHSAALDFIDYKDLKTFAAEGEAANMSTVAQQPGNTSDKIATRKTELSRHMGSKKTEGAVEDDLRVGSRGYNA